MGKNRFDWLDLLRGIAMVWMTVFHFFFDLSNAGFIHQNFYTNPVWTWQRTCILSLFLLCAGASQAIALQHGQSWSAFMKRWRQIAFCALLVTAGSAVMFPNSFIYFGVLHGMAVMLLIARLTASWGSWLWLVGGVAIAAKYVANYALTAGFWNLSLNERWLNWLGLINVKPITEDYVPLVPWMAVMWWGMAATQWWLKRHLTSAKPLPTLPRLLRPLAALGRWSLSYYMLHQPILLAGIGIWAYLAR